MRFIKKKGAYSKQIITKNKKNPQKAGISILILDKTEFKEISRNKEENKIMIKEKSTKKL